MLKINIGRNITEKVAEQMLSIQFLYNFFSSKLYIRYVCQQTFLIVQLFYHQRGCDTRYSRAGRQGTYRRDTLVPV